MTGRRDQQRQALTLSLEAFCFRMGKYFAFQEVTQARTCCIIPRRTIGRRCQRDPVPLVLSLEEFDKGYNPSFWPCGTVFLTKAIEKLRNLNAITELELLDKHAFFPISWQSASIFKEPASVGVLEKIRTQSNGVHLWNKISSKFTPHATSLLYTLFETFSLYPLVATQQRI